ncbi:B3 domain-containing protein REM16-like isoform X2 [Euphorbia lathyris]|uniref:B3 domain-containing protein REM16-like isoform X2 n=1 Tax=Euphorbia lathyris TaxID=212925 RepID=UPI0033131133
MAEGECGNCRSWEEDIYWNHFQSHQFALVLRAGFKRTLAIPEEFTKNLREKLPKSVSLKGPSGSVWQVGLTTFSDTVFLNHGWDEFANDNLLEENDLLNFKYNGASCFDVQIFDGRKGLCEKAAPYFVKKCGHKDQDSGSQGKRKIGESSGDDIYTTTPSGKPNKFRATTKKIRRPIEEINVSPMHASPNLPTEEINISPLHASLNLPTEEINPPVHEDFSASAEEIDTKPDIEHIDPNIVHDVPFISSRRYITEEEKRNVVELAQTAVTSNGFMTIMKPTHVSRRFYMSIPSSWMTKHAHSLEKQDVLLRVDDCTWHTKYYYQKSKNNGGLSSGWKNFATAQNLQEYDVCVFEPADRINDAIVLDVKVFHVHQ